MNEELPETYTPYTPEQVDLWAKTIGPKLKEAEVSDEETSNDYAIFTTLRDVRKHSNADRLKVATAAGYQVIVDLKAEEGELGIVIPEERQVSTSLGIHCNLFSKHPDTGEALGGYLDKRGRVKTVKLRGEESRALWLPLRSFATVERIEGWKDATDMYWRPQYTFSLDNIKLEQRLDSWNGVPLCRKFYAQRTRERVEREKKVQKVAPPQPIAKHYDTAQLRERIRRLPEGDIYVTLKLHGTSGRTGRTMVTGENLPWYKLAWNKVMPAKWEVGKADRHVTGSRNKIVSGKGKDYRAQIHREIESCGLDMDETWYYEIVGYQGDDRPIMGSVDFRKMDKATKKEAEKVIGGTQAVFHYQCKPGEYSVYIYRIVRDGRDLTYHEMCKRIREVECHYDPVPLLKVCRELDLDEANRLTRPVSAEECPLEEGVIREGIVVHVEHEGERVTRGLKHKGYLFCCLEGIQANDKDFVDTEATS